MSILNRATQGNFPTVSRASSYLTPDPPSQWEGRCSGCLQLPKLERPNSHSPVHEQEHRGNSHDSTVTTQFSGTSCRCSESPGATYLASHSVTATPLCPPSTCSERRRLAGRSRSAGREGVGRLTSHREGGGREGRQSGAAKPEYVGPQARRQPQYKANKTGQTTF